MAFPYYSPRHTSEHESGDYTRLVSVECVESLLDLSEMKTEYRVNWFKFSLFSRMNNSSQWVQDFKLVDFGQMGLFPEYLEMGKSRTLHFLMTY